MKLGQLIKHKMRRFFLEKSCPKRGAETSSRSSLNFNNFFLYAQVEDYQNIHLNTSCIHVILHVNIDFIYIYFV